jgi:RNA polymerase sigma-70 factor (ECF subfamily)
MSLESVEADQTAMRRLQSGDEAALNELIDRWKVRLFTFLARVVGESEAADLTQETFVRIYHSSQKWKPQAAFSTWMFQIATNLAHNEMRRRTRHPAQTISSLSESEQTQWNQTSSPHPTPVETVLQREQAKAVAVAIRDLPEEWRTVLVLVEYERLPQQEVAAVIGRSVKTVERYLSEARAQLRRDLARYLA